MFTLIAVIVFLAFGISGVSLLFYAVCLWVEKTPPYSTATLENIGLVFLISLCLVLINLLRCSDCMQDRIRCWTEIHPIKISFDTYLALCGANNTKDYVWNPWYWHFTFVCFKVLEKSSAKNNWEPSSAYYYFSIKDSIKYYLYQKRKRKFYYQSETNSMQIRYTKFLQEIISNELKRREEEQKKLLKENAIIINRMSMTNKI